MQASQMESANQAHMRHRCTLVVVVLGWLCFCAANSVLRGPLPIFMRATDYAGVCFFFCDDTLLFGRASCPCVRCTPLVMRRKRRDRRRFSRVPCFSLVRDAPLRYGVNLLVVLIDVCPQAVAILEKLDRRSDVPCGYAPHPHRLHPLLTLHMSSLNGS